ncbi:hypothetical protein H2198_009361 [Neophaeococcomyces mojaviensis]|uniref:Uncharacterized protein n=1 Tax=Neophaeococcomyces mojaviensis TaxID=3383035 RepID=A0ACC2ZUN9_9EURO|nr:hypothetical protein H2198_009361 [Knufia sp. JES_112]
MVMNHFLEFLKDNFAFRSWTQMTTGVLKDCELWSTVKRGKFYSIPENELIQQIYKAFKPEIERLKRACAVERGTPPRIEVNGQRLPDTPSELLFGENFDEVNRTLVGVLALRWITNNDYDRFTRGQPDNLKLTIDSFKWLRQYFGSALVSPEDIFALVLAMVVNDLGKDPNLAYDLLAETDKPLFNANHDTILLESARAGLVPCLDYLDAGYKAAVMLGLELGSELNAGQLAQAENVPVNLEGLLVMKGNERAFNLKFMEQILDVAGAQGHIFADGIKNLIEPVFQAFKTVHQVSLSIIKDDCSLRDGYDQILTKRGELLEEKGFRKLSVKSREDRALLRLLTMGRTATLEQAELFDRAFGALGPDYKPMLIHGLNIDAIEVDETAVVPYYMPAMLQETLRSTRGTSNQTEALTSLMRYLARVLRWTDEETNDLPSIQESATWPGVKLYPVQSRVFERNMTQARDTITSPDFIKDPSILDALPPPPGHLLQRRRTSSSV